MEWLGIMVVVGLVVIAIMIGWKLLKYALLGSVKIFKKATESGFFGIMVLIIGVAVAFPIMLILAVIIGWVEEKALTSQSYKGLQEPRQYNWGTFKNYNERALLVKKMDESVDLPCGTNFTLNMENWSLLIAEDGFGADWNFTDDLISKVKESSYYYLFDETVSTHEKPIYVQILRFMFSQEGDNNEPYYKREKDVVADYLTHMGSQGINLRSEKEFCEWDGSLGVDRSPIKHKFFMLPDSLADGFIEQVINIETPINFNYLISIDYFPNLSIDQSQRLEDAMVEVAKTLKYQDGFAGSFS
jgi:hypothetical protein